MKAHFRLQIRGSVCWILHNNPWGGYNRSSRPAVRQAKIYLAQPLPGRGQTTTPAPSPLHYSGRAIEEVSLVYPAHLHQVPGQMRVPGQKTSSTLAPLGQTTKGRYRSTIIPSLTHELRHLRQFLQQKICLKLKGTFHVCMF